RRLRRARLRDARPPPPAGRHPGRQRRVAARAREKRLRAHRPRPQLPPHRRRLARPPAVPPHGRLTDPMTLAELAITVSLLAGLGLAASRLGLSAIPAYLLAGLLLGPNEPEALSLVRPSEVTD